MPAATAAPVKIRIDRVSNAHARSSIQVWKRGRSPATTVDFRTLSITRHSCFKWPDQVRGRGSAHLRRKHRRVRRASQLLQLFPYGTVNMRLTCLPPSSKQALLFQLPLHLSRIFEIRI
nr:MAG: hypothetical protein [Molluscum contagiosum virus]